MSETKKPPYPFEGPLPLSEYDKDEHKSAVEIIRWLTSRADRETELGEVEIQWALNGIEDLTLNCISAEDRFALVTQGIHAESEEIRGAICQKIYGIHDADERLKFFPLLLECPFPDVRRKALFLADHMLESSARTEFLESVLRTPRFLEGNSDANRIFKYISRCLPQEKRADWCLLAIAHMPASDAKTFFFLSEELPEDQRVRVREACVDRVAQIIRNMPTEKITSIPSQLQKRGASSLLFLTHDVPVPRSHRELAILSLPVKMQELLAERGLSLEPALSDQYVRFFFAAEPANFGQLRENLNMFVNDADNIPYPHIAIKWPMKRGLTDQEPTLHVRHDGSPDEIRYFHEQGKLDEEVVRRVGLAARQLGNLVTTEEEFTSAWECLRALREKTTQFPILAPDIAAAEQAMFSSGIRAGFSIDVMAKMPGWPMRVEEYRRAYIDHRNQYDPDGEYRESFMHKPYAGWEAQSLLPRDLWTGMHALVDRVNSREFIRYQETFGIDPVYAREVLDYAMSNTLTKFLGSSISYEESGIGRLLHDFAYPPEILFELVKSDYRISEIDRLEKLRHIVADSALQPMFDRFEDEQINALFTSGGWGRGFTTRGKADVFWKLADVRGWTGEAAKTRLLPLFQLSVDGAVEVLMKPEKRPMTIYTMQQMVEGEADWREMFTIMDYRAALQRIVARGNDHASDGWWDAEARIAEKLLATYVEKPVRIVRVNAHTGND